MDRGRRARRFEGRRGLVAAQVALALTVLMGILALTADGGVLLATRRRAQAAADAAALAGAADLFKHFAANSGADSGSAATAATNSATANGFGDANSTVSVHVFPQNYAGGPNATRAIPKGYVEVTVSNNVGRLFSSVFGVGRVPITARAVARGLWVGASPAILALDPTGPGLSLGGNGSLSAPGGKVVINSSSASAANFNGNHASASAAEFDINGGTNRPGNIQGTTHFGTAPLPDPLQYLPEPNPNTLTPQTFNSNATTLQPGVYQGGISLSGKSNVTLQPGIYYMQGGGFSLSGQASVTGSGVMIFTDANGSISLTGQGNVTLSPPTSGPYAGISLFQARSSTNTISLKGNGSSNLTGTIYAAKGTLDLGGNGAATLGSQLIAYDIRAQGNGDINIGYSAGNVAKQRQMGLVE